MSCLSVLLKKNEMKNYNLFSGTTLDYSDAQKSGGVVQMSDHNSGHYLPEFGCQMVEKGQFANSLNYGSRNI